MSSATNLEAEEEEDGGVAWAVRGDTIVVVAVVAVSSSEYAPGHE